MDPTATRQLILDYIAEGEWEEATESARGLWTWIIKGGFTSTLAPIEMSAIPSVELEPRAAGLRHLVNGINCRIAGQEDNQ